MKEFFGFGGYTREPEGFLSWQHLTFVCSLLCIMAILAIWLGKRNRGNANKNRALIIAALLIDGFELIKIVLSCFRSGSAASLLYDLPLFLCSIQLITIPLAAFSKGRIREAALDFVCIFGLIGGVLGTVGAAQNYNSYPVLSMDNVISGITHCISGFSSLYILFAGMASMKRRNIGITFALVLVFCAAAYIANITIPYNYMFLMSGDGTPYDILYNLVNGSKVFYPLLVVVLFLVCIVVYYSMFGFFRRKKATAQK